MDQPVNIHRYIALISKEPLKKEIIKSWFKCVNDNAPSGTIATIQMVDDEGAPRAVKLIKRTIKNKITYMVPLSRDLLPAEVDKIVHSFMNENEDLDFDIETNATFTVPMDKTLLTKNHEKFIALANSLSKNKHEHWVKERLKKGWRFGPQISFKDKVHPLLLPWEQLPDTYKDIDMDWPMEIFDIFDTQGLTVVSKEILDKILKN